MAGAKVYAKGIVTFNPKDSQPAFALGDIVININQLNEWLIKTQARLELVKKNCSPFEYNYLKREKGYIYNLNTNCLYIRLSNQIQMQ